MMDTHTLRRKTLGILGGGQLAKLLIQCASRYGIICHVYDPDPNAPAAVLTPHYHAAGFDDGVALQNFASHCDVITSEFENIPVAVLDRAATLAPVMPHPRHFSLAQDRLLEKTMAQQAGLDVPVFQAVSELHDIKTFYQNHGPAILKRRHGGYDGKGQKRIVTNEDADHPDTKKLLDAPCIIEALVPFVSEISTIGARNSSQTVFLPMGINHHHQGILRKTTVPSWLPETIHEAAREGMVRVMDQLDYRGILTMEWFVTQTGTILFNECAPRVHNSGHWSIEGCSLSQFDLAIRALMDWPLPEPQLLHHRVEMMNVLGDDIMKTDVYLACSRAALHDYGKQSCPVGRKMGHVTFF